VAHSGRRWPTCRASAGAGEALGRTESGKAPPCMRWRGLARPRRTGWPVARSCRRRAPPAGARYPCQGPVSRLLARPRGRPQVVPVSSGETFLLPPRAPRKCPRPAISGSSAIHEVIPRKRAVIRISRRLSTGLFTAYPQAPGCKPENTGTVGAPCNRLSFLSGFRVLNRWPDPMRPQMARGWLRIRLCGRNRSR
jgi:hypothetical protein